MEFVQRDATRNEADCALIEVIVFVQIGGNILRDCDDAFAVGD